MVYAIQWIHCAHQDLWVFRDTQCSMWRRVHASFTRQSQIADSIGLWENRHVRSGGWNHAGLWLTRTEIHGRRDSLRGLWILDETSQVSRWEFQNITVWAYGLHCPPCSVRLSAQNSAGGRRAWLCAVVHLRVARERKASQHCGRTRAASLHSPPLLFLHNPIFKRSFG